MSSLEEISGIAEFYASVFVYSCGWTRVCITVTIVLLNVGEEAIVDGILLCAYKLTRNKGTFKYHEEK